MLNKQNILYFLVLLSIVTLPFDQLFTSAFPNVPISPFRVLTIAIACFVVKYNIDNFGRLKKVIITFYIYIFLSLISIFWSEVSEKAFLYTLQLFLMLAFLIVSVNELIKKKESLKLIAFYATIVGGIIAQLSLLGVFTDSDITLDNRLSFSDIGVNALAISMGYFFILGFYSILLKNSILKKILLIISLTLIFYFLFRTGTRSAIFGSLIALLIAFPISFKLSIKGVFSYIIISVTLFFGFNYVLNEVGERLGDRILSISQDDFESNARGRLWEIAFDFSSNNIMGTGAGSEIVAYSRTNVGNDEAHNVLISSFLQLGVFGFLLIFISMFFLYRNIIIIKNDKIRFLSFSLSIFFFLQIMKGSFLQTRLFWIPLIILFLCVLIDKRHYLNNSENN